MTAYQEFINNPNLKPGKIARLWELELNENIDDFIDFTRKFLQIKGFEYTGNVNGKAVYNNNYVFAGAVQDGNKVAIRINQM